MEVMVLEQLEAYPDCLQLNGKLPLKTSLLHLAFPRLIHHLVGTENVDVNAIDREGRTPIDALIRRMLREDLGSDSLASYIACDKLYQHGGLLRMTTKETWELWWSDLPPSLGNGLRMHARGAMPRWLPGSPGQPPIPPPIRPAISPPEILPVAPLVTPPAMLPAARPAMQPAILPSRPRDVQGLTPAMRPVMPPVIPGVAQGFPPIADDKKDKRRRKWGAELWRKMNRR